MFTGLRSFFVLTAIGASLLLCTFPNVRALSNNELSAIVGGGKTPVPIPGWRCGGATGTRSESCQALRMDTACTTATGSAAACAAAGNCFYCNAGATYRICVYTGVATDLCTADNIVPNTCGGVLMNTSCAFTPAGPGGTPPAVCGCPVKGAAAYTPLPGTCDKSDCTTP